MSSPPSTLSPADLRRRLGELTLRDERRLRRKLDRARGRGKRKGGPPDPEAQQRALAAVAAEIAEAEARIARRRDDVPAITYPPQLPVSEAREELRAAIRDHQVVVVAGETGSGKTTQLPKLCLELGRGVRGLIGHTQPRRIAARSVAARIAEELETELGDQIGYQVRFSDRTSERTAVKVMTDGVLLAEIQRDQRLTAYDTIIIDEAHERSLNIDFLLGYLRQLLPRRPDLKLIITSATIDTQRFADHFDGAAVVEVSGRSYPVEVRYRPLDELPGAEGDEADQTEGICAAVDELLAEVPGDILVFCSGEREIRDAADALRAMDLRGVEVLPLYARLSTAEQQRVFQPHSGRRIVLATNVAETSLTVPGIRAVVDPGTARISRYSNRTKVQRLPIEKISRASANQRAGRCGRVADGVCIRLYAEDDYEGRPEFTDPEILRTNLAAVILQMTALGLGDVAAFPFVDPPDHRAVRDAVGLLHELGAVVDPEPGPDQRLTDVGRQLATLPVDPRIGRMLVEADRNGCLREVLVIASALSISDVRERPAEHRQAADALHARFADETSDFLSLVNLWEYLREQQRALGSSAFRRMCKAEHLHHLRVREWQDLHSQLRSVAKDLGLSINDGPAEPDEIHRSLLAGLLSQVGLKQGASREYLGARGAKFVLWPGSHLTGSPPSWVMAAELTETSRLFARTAARVDPSWIEALAPHLVTRSHSEPRWSAKRGAAVATERVTLFGIPLVAGRTVAYGRIDPEVSRELFIRYALVEGEWRANHPFLTANRRILGELAELEARARRRDLVADHEVLFAFYDARIPEHVVSARHFDAWWKQARQADPDLLTFTRELLLAGEADVTDEAHPAVWQQGDLALPVSYRFEPGEPDDGVTVDVPLAALNRVEQAGFDWQVPGLRTELVTALIRSLPKDLRRDLVPVPEVVAGVVADLPATPSGEPLVDAVVRALHRRTGVLVPREAFDPSRVPTHLRVRYRVVDSGNVVSADKDLAALRARLADANRRVVALATGGIERSGATTWDFGDLPAEVVGTRDGVEVRAYPALVDEGATVGVRVLLTEAEQRAAMWQGTRRLLLLALPPPVRAVAARLSNAEKLGLTRSPHADVAALLTDCTVCAIDGVLLAAGGPVRTAAAWANLRRRVADRLTDDVLAIVREVRVVLAAADEARGAIDGVTATALKPSVEDARRQLERLVHPTFVTATGRARLPDLARYLRAIAVRFARIGNDVGRDEIAMLRIAGVEQELAGLAGRLGWAHPSVREIRWMVEELRVSLFAQQLGTNQPISEERVYRAIGTAAATA
jgi:ATP-dependent helicase HrpA